MRYVSSVYIIDGIIHHGIIDAFNANYISNYISRYLVNYTIEYFSRAGSMTSWITGKQAGDQMTHGWAEGLSNCGRLK